MKRRWWEEGEGSESGGRREMDVNGGEEREVVGRRERDVVGGGET